MTIVGILERPLRHGPVDRALSELQRVVGAYGREDRWYTMKIGYTSDYTRRWYAYRRAGFHALVPVYRTSSWRNAVRMEKALIDYARNRSLTTGWCCNVAAGRNGRVAEDAESFFVYLALARRYARLGI